ncbi:MAG: hypothetical protein PHF25_02990 [Candidatus Margulisbacteria bacterium]|nr:hypothetical protein [Candidatus Margulisiibacteriota bacterium]
MSDASKIDTKSFIQKVEEKKQLEAQKDIEDTINKLQNQILTPVQAKLELAKLNVLAQDVQINPDLKNKISDALDKMEQKMPDIKDLVDKEILEAIEEIQQGFTGEGISSSFANNDPFGISPADEFDPYKIDGNSTLSTYL